MRTTIVAFLTATLAAAALLAQEPRPRPSPKPADKAEPAAETKAVSLTVADRQNGWFRSSAERPGDEPAGFRQVPLNVDASPFVEGSRIRLGVGVEYNSVEASAETKQYPKLEIKQRLNLILEDGKPLRVAQSADPLSDRRVSLEVTATILR